MWGVEVLNLLGGSVFVHACCSAFWAWETCLCKDQLEIIMPRSLGSFQVLEWEENAQNVLWWECFLVFFCHGVCMVTPFSIGFMVARNSDWFCQGPTARHIDPSSLTPLILDMSASVWGVSVCSWNFPWFPLYITLSEAKMEVCLSSLMRSFKRLVSLHAHYPLLSRSSHKMLQCRVIVSK